MSKKEGKHYERKKAKEKDFYSVRSLIEEITGISEGKDEFEAAYKDIRRIIKTFQEQDGVDKGPLKIHKDFKDSFVEATKIFRSDEKFRQMIGKMRREEQLTVEECDILIEHFVNAIIINKTEEEKEKIKQDVEIRKEDEYFEKAEEIREIILQDIEMANKIKHYPSKLKYMYEYIEILKLTLSKWRELVGMHTLYESAQERVLKNSPHLLIEEPLSDENMTLEMLISMVMEVGLMQHENE